MSADVHETVRVRDDAEELRDYLAALAATTSELHDDTRAVTAQAEHALAYSRQLRRERRRERPRLRSEPRSRPRRQWLAAFS
jgi:hypothetical protein